MKRLVVLVLVLGLASLASAIVAPVTIGNVVWTISSGQLIGEGLILGDYHVLFYGPGYSDPTTGAMISPWTGADDGYGTQDIAGNVGLIQDIGLYYDVFAGDVVTVNQTLGVWFAFDITATEETTLMVLDTNFTLLGEITIPEPMTMALLGLGGLFLRRRKK